MKGVRFYAEYPSAKEKRNATRKELGNHSGNVVALFYDFISWYNRGDGISTFSGCDALAGVFDEPNSPVATTTVGFEYLRERCKRISEEQAREIHPELFNRLDAGYG
jgi:hypothetical protein